MALKVNVIINQNGDRADGYLAIDNVLFIRGGGQMGGNMELPKFNIKIYYTIFTDDTKSEILFKGGHIIPWDDTQDSINAFTYAYDKLKEIPEYSNATNC